MMMINAWIAGMLMLLANGVAALPLWHSEHSIPEADYQSHFNKWSAKKYRLTMVTGFQDASGKVKYNTVWYRKFGPAWLAYHGLTESQYQTKVNEAIAKGYKIVFVDGFDRNGSPRINCIFEKKAAGKPWLARHGESSAGYQSTFSTYVNQGYDLDVVSTYQSGGTERYASVFTKNSVNSAWAARHSMTAAQYQAEFNSFTSQEYRLVYVSAGTVGGSAVFSAIWHKSSGPHFVAFHGLSSSSMQDKLDTYIPLGYVPSVIDGYKDGGNTRWVLLLERRGFNMKTIRPNGKTFPTTQCFDAKIVQFMNDNKIKGASAAVMKDGKVVYSQGYGLRDVDGLRIPDTGMKVEVENVMPYTPFRVASISKPVTALAILRLVQEKKLSLDDKVFGPRGILSHITNNPWPGIPVKDNDIYDITVRHLLTHTGGWDSKATFDPMFRSATISQKLNINGPATCLHVIYYMFDFNLDFQPGSKFAYSNFGYCILGQIIEKLTGKPYETAVRQLYLDKAGVSRSEMYQGHTQYKETRDYESEYECLECNGLSDSVFPNVNEKVSNPYGGWHLEGMDAHGAWVSSAQQLLLMMKYLESPHCNSTIANQNDQRCLIWDELFDEIIAKPPGDKGDPIWYGLGFNVKKSGTSQNMWHTGSLPGTSTILVRTSGGYTWAFLANRRGFEGSIDSLMWDAVSCMSSWPNGFKMQTYNPSQSFTGLISKVMQDTKTKIFG